MQNYTTLEIYSQAILIFFIGYFLLQGSMLFYMFTHNSLLNRNKTIKKLKKLAWDEFELLCMEFFSKQGWQVTGNEKKGADGGIDIWMHKRSLFQTKSAIVQCKRYEDSLVTIKVVREMYGLMHEHEVEWVYIVTTSRFTKECYKFIEDKNMILIDGNELIKQMKKL
jgi:restriction system protein